MIENEKILRVKKHVLHLLQNDEDIQREILRITKNNQIDNDDRSCLESEASVKEYNEISTKKKKENI